MSRTDREQIGSQKKKVKQIPKHFNRPEQEWRSGTNGHPVNVVNNGSPDLKPSSANPLAHALDAR